MQAKPAREPPSLDTIVDDEFELFVQQNGRSYQKQSSAYELHRQAFQQAQEKVRLQNSKPDRLWTAAINKFSDWTEEEKATNLFGHIGGPHRRGDVQGSLLQSEEALRSGSAINETASEVPPTILFHEVISKDDPTLMEIWGGHAKDQGSCGSCWAFATTTMVEINLFKATGEATRYSEQDLVDCVPNEYSCGGTGGCEGATQSLAAAWILNNEWSLLEDLPYSAVTNTCAGGKTKLGLHNSRDLDTPELQYLAARGPGESMGLWGFYRLAENSRTALRSELYANNAVSVSVAAAAWAQYSGGVFDGCSSADGATAWSVNHAVVCTGWGEDVAGAAYFLIVNSWGSDWGENGYIRLLDQPDSTCGEDMAPEDGMACKDDNGEFPTSAHVCGECAIYYDSVVIKASTQDEEVPSQEAKDSGFRATVGIGLLAASLTMAF